MDLLHVSITESNYWRAKHKEYEAVMIDESRSATRLAQTIGMLDDPDTEKLSAALKAWPELHINLRPGATEDLDSKLVACVQEE
eukprot:3000233-Lingulodinium_polyedra.AAC.1